MPHSPLSIKKFLHVPLLLLYMAVTLHIPQTIYTHRYVYPYTSHKLIQQPKYLITFVTYPEKICYYIHFSVFVETKFEYKRKHESCNYLVDTVA